MKSWRTTLALLAVLTLAGCGDETANDTPAAQVSNAAVAPTGVTCEGDKVVSIIDFFEIPDGAESPAEAARTWGGVDGDPVALGDDGVSAFVLRDDGTAHTKLSLIGDDGTGWAVGATESCSGEGPIARRTGQVKLDIGHCYVEPLEFDGQEWALALDSQFGWGGQEPDGLSGTGTVTRGTAFDDSLDYVDDDGARLTFLSADDPRSELPSGWLCD